ncbi:MAG: ATP-binding protein, partial [Acidobacteriota bacterium]|nr:ATP-binding protein [Acidobacteriota bacterium]
SRLVDDLLDVSRITRGTISLREETVSLAGVIEAAVEQARRSMEERGHQFTLRLPAAPITLRADPARLEQVLANLLGNAAKYTPMGGRISVDVRVDAAEVEIEVRDNGIGLSSEARDRIFDLFVRSPDSRTNDPGGLGVGLTLARRIVGLHGGSVEARSDGRGCGSSFVVRLPVRRSMSSTPISEGTPADAFPAPGPGRRILVVDDNVDAAEGLSDFLKALGHSVRTVHDGASAIQVATIVHPEIVLLDIGLPDIDGHQVARRLRENAHLRASLLIALTGYGQERDRARSREAGFDHHLVKPVDLARLESLLKLPS